LILSGGLTVHNLQDRTSFAPETANPLVREFNDAVSSAISISDVSVPPCEIVHLVLTVPLEKPDARKTALFALTQHKGFRPAHPREDHFVPIYVAAGAGEDDNVHVLSSFHGCQTVAFGS
jgi:aromatic ring-opening dioxygenase catalytic subunit (LigB family)